MADFPNLETVLGLLIGGDIMKSVVIILTTMTLCDVALAQADSTALAIRLGNVIGSEEGCGLTYDQAKIAEFVESSVAADDMEFPSTLALMARSAEYDLKNMSTSAKTAHCTQITRVAKSYGFKK